MDGGYLSDPDGPYGSTLNPDALSFEALANTRCLVLLGEPGIGKSVECEKQFTSIEVQARAEGNEALFFNLRDYDNGTLLRDDIFRSARLQAWLSQSNQLYLYLDSLDEGLLSVNTLATLLSSELKKCPVERLNLRIACRTAEWPSILEDSLCELWGSAQVKVVELAPLRRKDVYQAAQAYSLAPEAFLEAVHLRDAVPLAMKPLTLNFLLKTFRKNQQLPTTKAELYNAGCLLLCEEQNGSRLASGRKSSLSSRQLLAVASRIAAVSMFCNRSAIWCGTPVHDAPEGDATFGDLVGGTEKVDGNAFAVDEEQIQQALATGLFTARGPQRLGWAHQTYAEYLAARYLKDSGLPLKQKMGVLIHPGDQEGSLIPQLHETAAWLAGLDINVFRQVVDADPQVLLRSDIATADVADRSRLVENLLRLFDEEKLLDSDYDLRRRYRNLSHPQLTEQLRPYVTDHTRNALVRRVAIDIAEACHVSTLQDELVAVALNQAESIEARINAAYAIVKMGDNDARAALRPLALGQAGSDPDDELKGCGLRALWPDSLSVQELFSLLTIPRRQNFHGAYAHFLSQDLLPHLKPDDLPLALQWVSENVSGQERYTSFGRLANKIIEKAWDHLEDPSVTPLLAKALLSRLRHFDDDLDEVISSDHDKRRLVLDALIPQLETVKSTLYCLTHTKSPLVISDDLPWLVRRIACEPSQEIKQYLADLLSRIFDFRKPGHLDLIIEAAKTEPLIAEKFSLHLTPVELHSPEAEAQRKRYLEDAEMQKPRPPKSYDGPSPTEQIFTYLDQFEAGDVDAWWRLNLVMAVNPDNGFYNEVVFDLTQMPGWESIDDFNKARITQGALQYLLKGDPHTDQWLGQNIIYRPAHAGYRAFYLLSRIRSNTIAELPTEVWQKWAPIILAYPVETGTGSEQPNLNLVELAYQKAKSQMIETLDILIDKENSESSYLFVLPRIEPCWDDDLANALLAKVKEPQIKPSVLGQLLGSLLEHRNDEARTHAESLIITSCQPEEQERMKVAARTLFAKTPFQSWPVLWPMLQDDPLLGKEIIATTVHGFRFDAVKELPEEHLADLYIWLVEQYPYKDDPVYEGVIAVGPDDSAREFRDITLRVLKERGTRGAVSALRKIVQTFPQLEWLRWSLIEAQNQTRKLTWEPVPPQILLRLVQDQEKRLVQNGEQLFSVLIESLQHLNSKLQGETPAAIDLWNQLDRTTFRPKDENDFTNYVKRHLDEDLKVRGIIVNREVEIRRGVGGAQGERTDVQVDAVLRRDGDHDYDVITVIIEAKGCWHDELMTAMETQLRDRYLNENQCRHGLYLVGWFNCEQWDQTDPRYTAKVRRLQKPELEQFLENQATSLSNDGVVLRSFVTNAALRPIN